MSKRPLAGDSLTVRAINVLRNLFFGCDEPTFEIERLSRRKLRKLLTERAAEKGYPLRTTLLMVRNCGRQTAGEILQWVGESEPARSPHQLRSELVAARKLIAAVETLLPDSAMTAAQVAFRKRVIGTMDAALGSRETLSDRLTVARDALRWYAWPKNEHDGGQRARAALSYISDADNDE